MQPWSQKRSSLTCWLLASKADRGDELSAEVARAGKAAERWERKYTALKEGVDALVSSVHDERARVRAEQTAMAYNLANMPTLVGTVTSERDSLARELEEIRASVRNPHEHSAVLGTDHVDRDHAAVKLGPLVAPARTRATKRATTMMAIATRATAAVAGKRVTGPLSGSVTSSSISRSPALRPRPHLTALPTLCLHRRTSPSHASLRVAPQSSLS